MTSARISSGWPKIDLPIAVDHEQPHSLVAAGSWGGAVLDLTAFVARPEHPSGPLRTSVFVDEDNPSTALPPTTYRVVAALRRSSSLTDLTLSIEPAAVVALGPFEDDNEDGIVVASGPASPSLPVVRVPLNYRRRRRRNSRGWYDD
jgi:hypothetical protein